MYFMKGQSLKRVRCFCLVDRCEEVEMWRVTCCPQGVGGGEGRVFQLATGEDRLLRDEAGHSSLYSHFTNFHFLYFPNLLRRDNHHCTHTLQTFTFYIGKSLYSRSKILSFHSLTIDWDRTFYQGPLWRWSLYRWPFSIKSQPDFWQGPDRLRKVSSTRNPRVWKDTEIQKKVKNAKQASAKRNPQGQKSPMISNPIKRWGAYRGNLKRKEGKGKGKEIRFWGDVC